MEDYTWYYQGLLRQGVPVEHVRHQAEGHLVELIRLRETCDNDSEDSEIEIYRTAIVQFELFLTSI